MSKIDLFKISEVELIYQRKVKACDRPKIKQSQEACDLFRANWNDLKINLCEEFKILLLDRNNCCMGLSTISSGGVSGVIVDSKLIFATALKARACALILAHNHPSGNLQPSHNDIQLTKKIVQAGQLLDISVLDHLILTDDHYYSISDNGLMP